MRYIVILETPSSVHYLQGLFVNDEEIVCLMQSDSIPSGFSSKHINICKDDPLQRDTYQRLEIHPDDRIILFADKKETLEALLNTILKVCDSIPIVAIVSDTEKTAPLKLDNISHLLTGELLHKNIEREWLYINDRKHTEKILNLTKSAENIFNHVHWKEAISGQVGSASLHGALQRIYYIFADKKVRGKTLV